MQHDCIMPTSSAARVGALRHGIETCSTLACLNQLRDLDVAEP
ncbi:MAG: hypothetical protein ACR2PG_01750 [Hyphomicrobiaceae bacterium]